MMLRAWCALALVVALSMLATPASAQPDRGVTNRAEAGARFEEGTKAFDAGDFRRAAEAFEAAERLAPSHDAVWNAARAWHRAGEAARAATLYARYLRTAPADASDRGTATTQLANLAPRLARIEVHGDGIEQLKLDDAPCDDRIVYVSRGAHILTALVGGRPMRKDQQVEGGDVVSVVFESLAPLVDRPAQAPIPPPRAAPRSNRPWPRWVAIGGIVLTSAAVGFTIASGVDTDNALSKFEAQSTQDNLSSGQGKQLRTNILLGTSVALGAATAAAAIWLVDWHPAGRQVEVGIEPAGGALRWKF
jgi:tetratricopeptide (TPR) repeat protein